jgi:plasmid stabilization system protein ParE
MIRDTQVTLPEAVTWYATEIGVASAEDAADALAAAIDGKIAEFAAAYVAANTEEGGN